jgi:Fic family protein
MFTVEIRPSLQLLQQIARIERFLGFWERSNINQPTIPSLERNILEASCLCLGLDPTTSPTAAFRAKELIHSETIAIEKTSNLTSAIILIGASTPRELQSFVNCHALELPLSLGSIELTHRVINGSNLSLSDALEMLENQDSIVLNYRKTQLRVSSSSNLQIFQAVAPYAINQKMSDLVFWANQEFCEKRYHPLLIIGVFHLMLLQISPYQEANIRLALTLMWQMLDQAGYSFVRQNHIAKALAKNELGYFNALKQAEKTAANSWSTLNIWLEFFLQALCDSCSQLEEQSNSNLKFARLSSTQKEIIDAIRNSGSATREQIVQDTGINISTVKYNLSILATRGHLKRVGGGRTTSYSLV